MPSIRLAGAGPPAGARLFGSVETPSQSPLRLRQGRPPPVLQAPELDSPLAERRPDYGYLRVIRRSKTFAFGAGGLAAQQQTIAWVGTHVLPHEADVRRWLARSMVDQADVEDVIQESYCRLSALNDVSHIQSGRAYFFQTARRIVLDQMRRSKIVRIEAVSEIDALTKTDDHPGKPQESSLAELCRER